MASYFKVQGDNLIFGKNPSNLNARIPKANIDALISAAKTAGLTNKYAIAAMIAVVCKETGITTVTEYGSYAKEKLVGNTFGVYFNGGNRPALFDPQTNEIYDSNGWQITPSSTANKPVFRKAPNVARCRKYTADYFMSGQSTVPKEKWKELYSYIYEIEWVYIQAKGLSFPRWSRGAPVHYGDGFNYRGRGFNQITFRNAYKNINDDPKKFPGCKGCLEDPDILAKVDCAASTCVHTFLGWQDWSKSRSGNGILQRLYGQKLLNNFTDYDNAVKAFAHMNGGLGTSLSNIQSSIDSARAWINFAKDYVENNGEGLTTPPGSTDVIGAPTPTQSSGQQAPTPGADNTGTPVEQEKKISDSQDLQSVPQTPADQITRIFKNTRVPQDIELVFKSTNRANQQIVAQTLGYAPVLFYNGLMIDSKDITLLTLTHEGLVPKLTAKITDSKGIFKSTSMPTDDTKISLFMNSRSSYLAPIRIDFKIIEFKFLTTTTFLITGIIDVPKLYTKFFASVPTSSSFDALQAIAKDCGLGFVTNIKETKDSQTWINTGLSYREFIKKIVDRSYISDESFQVCYIDYYYNLCYIDLSKEFKRRIEDDVAISSMGFDKLTSGTGKTEVDDQVIPMILTTERNSSTNINFIEKFTELNNSTSISLREGYRTNIGYLDKSKKELVQFKIEGQTSDPSKFMILKATSGDNEFYQNTKTSWYGKVDNQEDVGNTHANIGFAAASNKRNLLELIKLSARAYLPNYNFNLYPFRKVQVQVILPSATLAQPAGFDVRLTGEWLITSMEFRWVDGATKMYVDLKKRDLSLSPEEKIQAPPPKQDQNNKKTQPNENAPNDPAKKTEVKPKEKEQTIIIPDNEKFTGPTAKLKKAVQQQVVYTFNNASRWPYGRLSGGSYPWLCAGWTYNLAKHIIDALSKGDTYAFNKWGGAGNADDKTLRDALSKNGLYDEVLVGEIPYSKMFSTINSINWNYGEVAIYFSSYLTSTPVSGDPYKKSFRHAQIYTGDLFKNGDIIDSRKGRGWTTDRITNYGSTFVYGSKAAAYTFKLYRYKIKNQYLI